MTVAVITQNDYLYQKIYLSLGDTAIVLRGDADYADVTLFDTDSVLGPPPSGSVTVGRGEDSALRVPFTDEELAEVACPTAHAMPLTVGERYAYLCGEKIKLTELEAALLQRLVLAGGDFVSREELLRDVWHGEAEGGIVNVYVHYLREKLERGGEKIILSSRKHGYRICDKYSRKGAAENAENN